MADTDGSRESASAAVPDPARVEAIAKAILDASPLDALERISGPALTALAQGYLNRHDADPSTEETGMATVRLTTAMWALLFRIADHERLGRADLKAGTVNALDRRGLIESGPGGRWVLTDAGRRVTDHVLALTVTTA